MCSPPFFFGSILFWSQDEQHSMYFICGYYFPSKICLDGVVLNCFRTPKPCKNTAWLHTPCVKMLCQSYAIVIQKSTYNASSVCELWHVARIIFCRGRNITFVITSFFFIYLFDYVHKQSTKNVYVVGIPICWHIGWSR